MAARVLLLISLPTLIGGQAMFARATLPQAPATPQQETAVSAPDSSKQANEQTPATTKEDKDNRDAQPQHRIHVRLGTVSFGLGYSHFHGPYYYPYGAFGFYPYRATYPSFPTFFCDPFWCAATFLNTVYSGSLAYAENKGEVRLTTDPKTAQVYIDGAYAGTADHLKTMWLDSGAYDLSVSATGRTAFHQRIYILSGKSLKILARLEPAKAPDAAHEEAVKP